MISGLESVKSKRIWFVPEFSVWGLSQEGQIDYLVVEQDDSDKNIFLGSIALGSSLQEVSFCNLTDHRGNTLPSSIDSPKVIPRSRSEQAVFIVGEESNTSFRIARDPDAVEPVMVDLLIMEMGK
jgi:hypothetical protein